MEYTILSICHSFWILLICMLWFTVLSIMLYHLICMLWFIIATLCDSNMYNLCNYKRSLRYNSLVYLISSTELDWFKFQLSFLAHCLRHQVWLLWWKLSILILLVVPIVLGQVLLVVPIVLGQVHLGSHDNDAFINSSNN
jgi:hypothetical protein